MQPDGASDYYFRSPENRRLLGSQQKLGGGKLTYSVDFGHITYL